MAFPFSLKPNALDLLKVRHHAARVLAPALVVGAPERRQPRREALSDSDYLVLLLGTPPAPRGGFAPATPLNQNPIQNLSEKTKAFLRLSVGRDGALSSPG